jgi:protein-S-isoprenylcysteine O-methyltransferase Ste14
LVGFADTPANPIHKIIGSALVVAGMAVALVAMSGLGMHTTVGQKVEVLRQAGLYRLSRNPQLDGGGLAVLGVSVLWPTWYALGWIVLYGVMAHLMVLAEEEHLRRVHGETYDEYCRRIHRYIGIPRRSQDAAA